jgi:hypothetical protein
MMTDPTPTTPITIGDRMIFLSRALSGIDERTLTDLYGQIATALTAADLANEQIDTIVTLASGINTQTDNVNRGIGGPGYDSLELWTVRGALWAIYQMMKTMLTQLRYITSGNVLDPIIDTDVPSIGSVVIDGYRYAVWDSLPVAGMSLDPTKTQITYDVWGNFDMLAQTTDPAPHNGDETMTAGTWWPLTGSGVRYARVLPQYPIAAYLRNTALTPSEPYVIWSETDAVPFVGPGSISGYYWFAVVEIPVWADRVQARVTSTQGAGNFQIRNENYEFLAGVAVGTVDDLFTLPVGAKYVAYNAGDSSHRATGIIWALPPGVDPVP